MNRHFTILSVFTFAVAILCSCSQDSVFEPQDEVIDIPIPAEGYIFFDVDKVATRGTDMTGQLAADFSVIGYRYPSTWGAAKPLATQMRRITYADNGGNVISESSTNADNYMGVFFGEDGKSWSNATPTSQVITYAGGVHSYTPLQSWQKGLSYAFFAWYPSHLVVNPGNNGTSNSNHVGNPFITYTLPAETDRDARKNMYDVVTACEIDYKKALGGTTVTFSNMQHRLAALDIKTNNMVDASALKETYTEFGDVNSDSPVVVDVTALSLTLKGIKTSVRIPLNTDDDSEQMVASGSENKTYTGFKGASDIPYYLKEKTDGTMEILPPTSLVGEDELLILIPQTENIDVAVNVGYTIKCGGKSRDFTFNTADDKTKLDITIEGGLESGYYHYLLLNLTKSGLFVSIDKGVTWEKGGDVEHTFE